MPALKNMISKFLIIFSRALLLILLICQGILIYLSINYKGIPVSNLLIQKKISSDLKLNLKETLFYFPFHFKLVEPEFTQIGNSHFQYSGSEIFLSWMPNLKKLDFKNWKIHCYTGQVNTKFYPTPFQINNLIVSFNGSYIQNANLRIQNEDKEIHLNYFPREYPADHESIFKTPKSTKLVELFSNPTDSENSLYSLINAFHSSKNSQIKFLIEGENAGSYSIRTHLSSESLKINNTTLKSVQIESRHKSDSGQGILFFEAEDFSNSIISAQGQKIRGELGFNNLMQIDSITLRADSSNIKGVPIDSFLCKIKPKRSNNFIIDGILFHQNHALNILTDYQLNADKNTLIIKAYLNLDEIKNHIPNLENFNINSLNSAFADTKVVIDKNFNLFSAKGFIQIEKTIINLMPLEFFRSEFQLINQAVKTYNYLKVNNRTSFINSNYNIESGDYFFKIQGTNYTSDFSSIFPESWQDNLSNFSYNAKTKCTSNFTISGFKNKPSKNTIIGSVKAKNIDYRGVKLKYSNISVINKNYITEITLKDLQTENEKAEGFIKITNKPDGFNKPESIQTRIKSNLTINTATKLFGPKVQKVLLNFESADTLEIDYESTFFNPYYDPDKIKSYYNLFVKKSNHVKFFNRPFNNITANIYGKSNCHYIREGTAKFSGGLLNFEADISNEKNSDPNIRIDLSLSNCDYNQTIKNTFKSELYNASINESIPLILDLNIKSNGSLLDFTKHNGYGSLAIYGSGLGKIHILGPFSKALNKINIPIGVFSLNNLESDFLIEKKYINFKNIEINGEESYVFGHGQIFIPEQSINFKMKVDLLKNRNLSFSKLGSIGKILNPVTNILNFTVTGTLQNQKWRSALDPRNLFK